MFPASLILNVARFYNVHTSVAVMPFGERNLGEKELISESECSYKRKAFT
jgi:hypothetical protein